MKKVALCLFALTASANMMAAETIYLSGNKYYGTLTQGEDYFIEGVTTGAGWYYDVDFFKVNGDGSLKFMAVTGDYTIKADTGKKYYRVFAGQEVQSGDTTTSTATLQSDGSGAIWVIGEQVNKPSYSAFPSDEKWWSDPDHTMCMAQVRDKVYQITFTVGEQLNRNKINFKFFTESGWGGEFNSEPEAYTQHRIFCNSDVFRIGTTTDYGSDGKTPKNGNLMLVDGARLYDGDVCKFTIDCTNGIDDVELVVEVERLGTVTEDVTFNGVRMTETDNCMRYEGTLEQNANIAIGGLNISDWYIDPDYFEQVDATTLKFRPVTGEYRVEAYASKKYFRVMALSGGHSAKLQSDGTGAIWVLGENTGKPTYANAAKWEEGSYKNLCMAQISPKVYQVTLVAGEQIPVDKVNFKFFHQNGWGGEFKGSSSMTCNSSIFAVGTGSNGHDDGNIYLIGTLTEGQPYVFTIDCTNGISNVELKVSGGDTTTAIQDIESAEQQKAGLYDLQGRRVNCHVNQGIYVKEGKKVVLK